MQEIKFLDFEKNEIKVADKVEILKMEIATIGYTSEVYFQVGKPDNKAFIFLHCNIGNVLHYGITVHEGNSVKWYLIKSIEFRECFKIKRD